MEKLQKNVALLEGRGLFIFVPPASHVPWTQAVVGTQE